MRVVINNAEPRRDVRGDIVEAFEGTLLRHDGVHYLYGVAYGGSDGLGNANHYNCYSSPNLADWTPQGDILPDRPAGQYYTPKVVYNERTGAFVLWYNACVAGWPTSRLGVAVSASPAGPFTIVNDNVPLGVEHPGCQALFVDNDGAGYVAYNTHQDHLVRIERLSDDYLSGTGERSEPLPEPGEGQILFRRGDVYYCLVGSLCCYCPQGASADVYTASRPLGPFTRQGNVNPWLTDRNRYTVPAQQFAVAEMPTPDGTAYLWLGSRWGSTSDGDKGHDFLYWSPPLAFDEHGRIRPMEWTDAFTLDVATAANGGER